MSHSGNPTQFPQQKYFSLYNFVNLCTCRYSIEHKNEKKSMYNVFFPTSKPYYVPDSGVTHADELLYLFHMNIPLLLCDLPSLASEF